MDLVKKVYSNPKSSCLILNQVFNESKIAIMYSLEYRNQQGFLYTLRRVVKDLDQYKYTYRFHKSVFNNKLSEFRNILKQDFHTIQDFNDGVYERKPQKLSNIPYDIVKGYETDSKVYVEDDKLFNIRLADKYIVRNIYLDVLHITDSLEEAKRKSGLIPA